METLEQVVQNNHNGLEDGVEKRSIHIETFKAMIPVLGFGKVLHDVYVKKIYEKDSWEYSGAAHIIMNGIYQSIQLTAIYNMLI